MRDSRHLHLLLCLLLAAVPLSLRATCPPPYVQDNNQFDQQLFGSMTMNCSCVSETGWFELGTNTSYGTVVGQITADALGNGFTADFYFDVTQIGSWTGPATLYHFRAGASDCFGTSYTGDGTFVSVGWASITNPPQPQTVTQGGNATFSVAAISAQYNYPIFYQWATNGNTIPWATNATFTLTNAQINQNGMNVSALVANQYFYGGWWHESSGALLTVLPIPQPTLQAKLSGTALVLSWPVSAADFNLETCGGIGSGTWSNVSATAVTNGAVIQVSMPASNTVQFFRLSDP